MLMRHIRIVAALALCAGALSVGTTAIGGADWSVHAGARPGATDAQPPAGDAAEQAVGSTHRRLKLAALASIAVFALLLLAGVVIGGGLSSSGPAPRGATGTATGGSSAGGGGSPTAARSGRGEGTAWPGLSSRQPPEAGNGGEEGSTEESPETPLDDGETAPPDDQTTQPTSPQGPTTPPDQQTTPQDRQAPDLYGKGTAPSGDDAAPKSHSIHD